MVDRADLGVVPQEHSHIDGIRRIISCAIVRQQRRGYIAARHTPPIVQGGRHDVSEDEEDGADAGGGSKEGE